MSIPPDSAYHDEHTSYRTARNAGTAMTCATEYIDQFLITLEAPPEGTVCDRDPES